MQDDLHQAGVGNHRRDGLTLICDGNNLAHRANHALHDLGSADFPVGSIYGTLISIRSAVKRFEPDRILVAWDSGKSIFRTRLFPEYKAHRSNPGDHEKEEERRLLQEQISKLKTILYTLGVNQCAIAGVEADDIICVASRELPGNKVILSCDRDFCQLVREDTSLFYLIRKELVTLDTCQAIFGLPPDKYLHKRILMGDESDGIPGIVGIGEKTAEAIVKLTGTSDYDTLMKYYDQLKSNSRTAHAVTKVARGVIERNTKLMDLTYDYDRKKANILPKIRFSVVKPDFVEFRKLLVKYNFAALLRTYNEWVHTFRMGK